MAVGLATLSAPAYAGDDDQPGFVDARGLHHGLSISVSGVVQTGGSEFASNEHSLNPAMQGLLIRDRNGMTSRMVIGLLVAIAGAMAQSGPKSVESTSYRSGNYIVTETKTTYYSEAEKAEMAEATSDTIDGLFSSKFSDFELHLYSRDLFDRGESSGYKINMLIGGGDNIGFETGLGFGKVNSMVDDNGIPTRINYKYLGMPFRLSAITGPVRVALTFEWNWLSHGVSEEERALTMDVDGSQSTLTASHPWHLDVSTLLLKRIAVSGGITAQKLETTFGYYATAGLVF